MLGSAGGRGADRHAVAGHHLVGSVQAGHGQPNALAQRHVATGTMEYKEQAVDAPAWELGQDIFFHALSIVSYYFRFATHCHAMQN